MKIKLSAIDLFDDSDYVTSLRKGGDFVDLEISTEDKIVKCKEEDGTITEFNLILFKRWTYKIDEEYYKTR